MADPLYNATCRISRAVSATTGTNNLTRSHGDEESSELRCSLRQLSVEQSQGIFGAHQVEAWRLRVVPGQAVPTASMIAARLDGAGEEWLEYRIQTSRRIGRLVSLLVTRV